MALVPTMRAFCACNLDVASVRRLTSVAEALRAHPQAARARWVPATKMHVTLKFFGEIDLGLAGPLADVLAPLALAAAPLPVSLQPLSAFPGVDRARVIMVPLADPGGALGQLAERFEKSVEEL